MSDSNGSCVKCLRDFTGAILKRWPHRLICTSCAKVMEIRSTPQLQNGDDMSADGLAVHLEDVAACESLIAESGQCRKLKFLARRREASHFSVHEIHAEHQSFTRVLLIGGVLWPKPVHFFTRRVRFVEQRVMCFRSFPVFVFSIGFCFDFLTSPFFSNGSERLN